MIGTSGQAPRGTPGQRRLRVPLPFPGELPVHLRTVAEVRAEIAAYRPRRELRRMTESVHGWRAHYETFLGLCARTRKEDWPFQVYPSGWSEQVERALAGFHEELERGTLACHFPERASSNVRQLAQALEIAAHQPALLNGRQVGLVRVILSQSEQRWGPIGSAQRASALARREEGGGGGFEEGRALLLRRLEALNPSGGIDDIDGVLAAGSAKIPTPLAERAQKAWLAVPSQLVSQGIVTSPQELASLSARWADQATRHGCARDALRSLASITWRQFPASDVMDRASWDRLLAACGSMTRLSPSDSASVELFRSTSEAARGTLYERYYALPLGKCDLDYPALLDLCRQRARRHGEAEPRKAPLAEELRVLTSDGLWPVWVELRPQIDPAECAEKVWKAILRELAVAAPRLYQRRQRHRRVAHIWQRLVFFLSLAGERAAEAFVQAHAPSSPPAAGQALRALTSSPQGAPLRAWLGPGEAPL